MKLSGTVRAGAGALALAVAFGQPAAADEVADFYKDKTLVIFNGLSAGGAYWTYARTLAVNIGRHIPGNPTVIMKTRSGGVSRVLANWLYNVAPKDGLVFGGIHERMGLEPEVYPKGTKFDGRKFNWIGSIAKQKSVCFTWHASKIKTIKDAITNKVLVGSSGSSATASVMPRLLNTVVGTKFEIVRGYEMGEAFLSMERGEVEGICGYGWASLKTQKPDWIRDKKLNFIVQFSKTAHPDIPDVPVMIDQVTSEDDRKTLEILFGTQDMGRPYAAPPGVPQARVAALRRAFDATMKDPKFLADAKKSLLEVDPISGKEIQELITKLYDYPKELDQRVASFRKPNKAFDKKRKINWVSVDTEIGELVRNGFKFKAGNETHKVRVHNKNTAVTITGKKAKGKQLKVGMKCAVTYSGNQGIAKSVACE